MSRDQRALQYAVDGNILYLLAVTAHIRCYVYLATHCSVIRYLGHIMTLNFFTHYLQISSPLSTYTCKRCVHRVLHISAGGGKSECYKTLRDALNLIHQNEPEGPANQSVTSFCLNPKSISLGELYGAYNPVSNDWKDGLASKLVREAVTDDSNSMKWLVFDGPVDAVWVENLNTVMLS